MRRILLTLLLAAFSTATLNAQIIYGPSTVTEGETVSYIPSTPWCPKVWNLTNGGYVDPGYCPGGGGLCLTFPFNPVVKVQWDCSPTSSGSLSMASVGFWWICGWSGITTKNVTIQPASLGTSGIVGPSAVCLGEEVTYYVTPTGTDISSYTWSVGAGGTIVSGAGTASIQVKWTGGSGPGSKTVSMTAGSGTCTATPKTKGVTVSGAPSCTINGPAVSPTQLCGATSYAYNVSLSGCASPPCNNYSWDVPYGFNVLSPTSSSTMISVDPYAASGTVTFHAVQNCVYEDIPFSCSKNYTIDPWPTPVEEIRGAKSLCEGTIETYEIDSRPNADTYYWSIVPAGAGTISGSGTSITVNWTLAGTHELKVQPFNTNCSAGPVFTANVTVHPYSATANIDTVTFDHTNLSGGTTGKLIVNHCANSTTCIDKELEKATINVLFNTGEYYEYGTNAFSTTVDATIKGYDAISGGSVVATYTSTLTIDQTAPEVLFHKDVSAIYDQVYRWELTYTYAADAVVSSDVNLEFFRVEDFAYDVRSASPLVAASTVSPSGNQMTFAWTSSCIDFENYEFQLLRLFNSDPAKQTTTNITVGKVDWSEALSIETYSSDKSITITMAEGTGYYAWRVRPIGDAFENGIGNHLNWGEWSNHNVVNQGNTNVAVTGSVGFYLGFYTQFDDDKNWSYNRSFAEGDVEEDQQVRIAEGMTFANGLNQVEQTQRRLAEEENILANQTVYDYSGRAALKSMTTPVPTATQSTLGFIPNMMQTGGSKYTAADFDTDANYKNPAKVDSTVGNAFSYFSNNNTDLTIPSAEGYPYTRTLYYPDDGGREMEQGGLGKVHRIKSNSIGADSRTTKTYFSGVSDDELIRVFGDEAPDNDEVILKITLDEDKVTRGSYIGKDGKTYASFLIKTGDINYSNEANSPLLGLASQDSAGFTVNDTISNAAPFTPYGNILNKTRTFVNIPTTNVSMNYQLDPKTVEDICMNYCTSCDYWVQFLVHRTDSPDVALLDTSFQIPPTICDSVDTFTFVHNFNAGVGTYSFTRKILTNTVDSLNPLTGGGYPTFLQEHLDSLEALYDSTIAADLAPIYAFLDTTGGSPLNLMGLYDYLGIDTTVNNPDEVYEDSVVYIHVGCDSISIPISFCPAKECDPDSIDFANYFIDRWSDSTHYYNAGAGTHPFLNNDYTTIQFNDMISSMLVDGGYDCDSLWECWSSLVESYPTMVSIAAQDTNFEFNMVEQFLNCTGRRWKLPNPGTTTAHSGSYSSGGYLSHAFAYMHDTIANNCECACLAVGVAPAYPCVSCGPLTTQGQYDTLYQCATSISPGVTVDPVAHATATIDSCEAACESKRYAFRTAAIRMFHNNQMYVEGDLYYLAYDNTWGQVYVPNSNAPRSAGHIADSTDITLAELDCMIDSLVDWCKEGCGLTIFGSTDSVGTAAEILAIQQRMTYAFDLKLPDPITNDCDSGYVKFSPYLGGGGGGASTYTFNKQWDYTFGGDREDRLYDIKETADRNYVAVGFSLSSATGNKTTPNISSYDGWIIKFDDNGNILWEMTIGGEEDDYFRSVHELPNGNFLVGGYSNSGAGGNKQSGNFGGFDYWLLEVDPSSSTIVLDKNYGGERDDIMSAAIETNNKGHYLMGGYSESTAGTGNKSAANYGGHDYWVIEVDPGGSIQWDQSYGGIYDDRLKKLINVGADGEYALAGYSNSPISLKGQGNKTSNNFGYDYWILKIDGNSGGGIVWQRAIQGEADDKALDITHSGDGHFVIAGRSNSPRGFDKSQNGLKYDYWVTKLRGDGTSILWDQTLGGSLDDVFNPDDPICFSVERTQDNGFIIAGSSASPISGQKTEAPITQQFDYWMVKLDAGGSYLWDKVIGGEEVDGQTVVRVLDEDCFLAAGFSSSRQNPAYGHHSDVLYGHYDYWVVKYCMTEDPGQQDTCSFPDFCFRFVPYDEFAPADSNIHVFEPYTCEEVVGNSLLYEISQQLWNYKQSQLTAFESAYMNKCADRDNINDVFWLSYGLAYHHYTLHYFDRAGRKIRTVPPQGVDFLPAPYDRNTATDHSMETFYFYNSMGQKDSTHTPDGNGKKFYYDAAGNMRFSQDAQQKLNGEYFYMKYDEHNRMVESGLSNLNPSSFFNSTFINDPTFPSTGYERTFNQYSTPASGGDFVDGSPQRFLTNRISYTYTENGGTHVYSYDPHGNVEWLWTWTPYLGKNFLRYTYNLVSKTVKEIEYNPSLVDELYQRYRYDSDNRMTSLATSREGILWEDDITFSYYSYGPLNRKEVGEDQLQGMDYVYTLQGWLKAQNFPTLDASKDPGGDNSGANRFAPDAYGQLLSYYDRDWARTGSVYLNSNPDVFEAGSNRNLYGGNISAWSMNSINSGGGLEYENIPLAHQYRYDEAYRLHTQNMSSWNNPSWNSTADYQSAYTYDGNGNILSLLRNGYAGSGNVAMDEFTYTYNNGRNQLNHVSDAVAAGNYSTDIDSQSSNNYAYDAIGNLTKDDQALITNIDWLANGKIKRIQFDSGAPQEEIEFFYDPFGIRIAKVVKPMISDTTSFDYTLYVKDAFGKTIATYKRKDTLVAGSWEATTTIIEQPLYGNKLEALMKNSQITEKTINWQAVNSTAKSSSDKHYRVLNQRVYRLEDHLGNVRITFSDVKLATLDGSNNPIKGTFDVDLKSLSNYTPYGVEMPGMVYNTSQFRYGFNGMEKDNEVKGLGNSYDFGGRIYDPRLGRWFSVDPMESKYPNISPYAAFNNDPIFYIDPDGEENIPALIWAAKNMANKGIPFAIWYGGDGGWTYKAGKVPTETVCYESCWTSYMNGADDATMATLKTGFSTKSGGFKGRSHDTGGMNWFKAGDGTDRKFETDITKGELGDIIFMGEVGDMEGHAVLLASEITKGTIEVDGETVETITFYALSTSSDTDSGNYGGRTFTFHKVGDKWLKNGNDYEFKGYGQMTNVDATDEQKTEATDLIDDIKGE
jgi:RHS repeat-associated protein